MAQVGRSKSNLSQSKLASRTQTSSGGSRKAFYIACGIIALLSTATMVAMAIMYKNLKEEESPTDLPMEQLRNTLAAALGRPEIKFGTAMQVAGEVRNLPSNIQMALVAYDEKKKKYRDLFQKAMRTSSGPWRLHGRSLYYFSKGKKTWYDAESFCISRDAHLASILNNEEQNFITSQLQHASWIGLTDENEEGMWRWSDGSRLVAQYWSDGQPNNEDFLGESSEDCTTMVRSSAVNNWNDENCHKLYRWVCKENLDLDEP